MGLELIHLCLCCHLLMFVFVLIAAELYYSTINPSIHIYADSSHTVLDTCERESILLHIIY